MCFSVQEVKKKWINVKDAWLKSCKLKSKNIRKRKYIYNDQLQFLTKVADLNETTSSIDYQGNQNSNHSTDEEGKKALHQFVKPVLEELEPVHQRLANKNESCLRRKTEEFDIRLSVGVDTDPKVEDPRLMFFKGILPSIKHFNNDQFIDFQIGVLQLIKNISSQNSTQ